MADLLVRGKRKKVLVDYLVQFRWILVIFVVLPISSLIYLNTYLGDMWSAIKSEERRHKEHHDKVQKVVKRLRQRNPKKDGLVCTARKPWVAVGMRNVDYKRARRFEVDLSGFRNILEIDADRMVAKVEPLVNMGQITRATCPMNLSLAVVPELEDLTVGGLINGYGIEGSSHIYGLFSDTVIAVEMVLADGHVVRATKDNEYSDLFYGVPWSQGTLGFLVSAEIKLIPVKEYMRLTYTPVRGSSPKDVAQGYADCFTPRPRDGDPSKVPADFVEGIVYSETEGVMMTGVYASKEEAKKKGNKINSVGWWFKPWFYQHAQTALVKGEFVEYIPTRQYYHRHTRCLFWEVKLILPLGDQLWFRYLFGWLMPPKISLLKATQGEAIRNYYHNNHVIQDMLVPLYKVYPLWLCPHRLYKLPVKTMVYPEPGFELHQRQGDTSYAQMFTDVGVYYTPACIFRGEEFDGAEAVHRLEQWLIQNHGYETQYAVTELNEKDFWRMFDASHYELCRHKYGAVGTFMSVYYKSKKGRKTQKEPVPLPARSRRPSPLPPASHLSLLPNPRPEPASLPRSRLRSSSTYRRSSGELVPAASSDGGNSSSRRGAQVARRRRSRALAPGRRRRLAPPRAEAQLRPRLRQGPRATAAHFQKATHTQRGQGILDPVGVSAIFFANRAAANGVTDRAANGVTDRAVPLADFGHAPAPCSRGAAGRPAPDLCRKEGRAGTAGGRRYRAVQGSLSGDLLLFCGIVCQEIYPSTCGEKWCHGYLPSYQMVLKMVLLQQTDAMDQ